METGSVPLPVTQPPTQGMGACSSLPDDELEERANSRMIERECAASRRAEAEQVKLLLLGAGESGKSTIFKQMKLLFGVGFSELERRNMNMVIYSNLVHGMNILLERAAAYGLEFSSTVRCVT